MHHARQPLGIVHDRNRHDAMLLHAIRDGARQLPHPRHLRILRHDRSNGDRKDVTAALDHTPNPFKCAKRAKSSSDSPLFEIKTATSSLPTIPRSPCTLSAGWRKVAGVPVDVSVAAIFLPISPDLPTPATMTRPEESA